MMLGVDIALTHLRGRLRQTAVSVLGVATGVGFFIAIAALMEGSQRDFIEKIIDATPHIVMKDEYRDPPRQPVERIYSGGAIDLRGVKPEEELRGLRAAKRVVSELRARPGLFVAPILRGQVVMRHGGKDVAASLIGIEPEAERHVSTVEADMRSGDFELLRTTANGVILGSGLADRLGATVGDTLSVSSSAGVLIRMKIVGVFHTGVVGVDQSEAMTLLKKAQVLLGRPNVINQIRMKLADVDLARAEASSIEARYGYRTESWDEANESILEVLFIRNVIIYTVVGAILIVAAFGIFNIISTVTFEKSRDIAILKSLGFRAREVRSIFVFEGLLVGLAGTVLGWGFGYGLSRILGSIKFEVQSFTELTRLPLYEWPGFYAIAAAFAIGSAVLAAWIPANRAARLNPVDIIRGAA